MLANLSQDVPMIARSNLMSALIRYGLRGCRIGEASNPGPPSARISEGVSEAVIEYLEETFTVVDRSDEEPLVRSMTGRHVVRRVGEPGRGQCLLRCNWMRRRCIRQHVAICIVTNSQSKWTTTGSIQSAKPVRPHLC